MTDSHYQTAAPKLAAEREAHLQRFKISFAAKLAYAARVLPSYAWQRMSRRTPDGPVHVIIALADHFEPAIVPGDPRGRAPADEQERRLERWCRDYPRLVNAWRDSDGRPFQHTYFYPAEQSDKRLVERLAEHCHEGWGEIEIHLHHGIQAPDTAENTRRTLVFFRNQLEQHGCLSYLEGKGEARFVFVHGNFALANSAGGRACGVDSEMQVLAETGCYADMTLPTGIFHWAQIAKINSLYECGLALERRAPQRKGHDLIVGREPRVFPLIMQGPLLPVFAGGHRVRIENGALLTSNPPTLRRLELWKQAAICVKGRPNWLFIKLHCHSMDPTQEGAVLGEGTKTFLQQLVTGAKDRQETLHFVSAREMVNVALAACAGREGNPGEYRDYRFKRVRDSQVRSQALANSEAVLKG